MGTYRIGEYQGVFVAFMPEEVIDTLLFHKPADEIKVCFPVLYAVLPGPVASTEQFFEIRKTVIAEHLRNNFRNFLLLEDAAVRGTG